MIFRHMLLLLYAFQHHKIKLVLSRTATGTVATTVLVVTIMSVVRVYNRTNLKATLVSNHARNAIELQSFRIHRDDKVIANHRSLTGRLQSVINENLSQTVVSIQGRFSRSYPNFTISQSLRPIRSNRRSKTCEIGNLHSYRLTRRTGSNLYTGSNNNVASLGINIDTYVICIKTFNRAQHFCDLSFHGSLNFFSLLRSCIFLSFGFDNLTIDIVQYNVSNNYTSLAILHSLQIDGAGSLKIFIVINSQLMTTRSYIFINESSVLYCLRICAIQSNLNARNHSTRGRSYITINNIHRIRQFCRPYDVYTLRIIAACHSQANYQRGQRHLGAQTRKHTFHFHLNK